MKFKKVICTCEKKDHESKWDPVGDWMDDTYSKCMCSIDHGSVSSDVTLLLSRRRKPR